MTGGTHSQGAFSQFFLSAAGDTSPHTYESGDPAFRLEISRSTLSVQGRLVGTDADLGPFGMNPESGTAPSSLTDQSMPGRGRRQDPADALGEHGEPAGGDVPKLWRGDHLPDLGDLASGQPVGRGVGTGGFVLEFAGLRRASPGVQAGGREAQDSQVAAKPPDAAGAIDGA